jgi:hypothetical protein
MNRTRVRDLPDWYSQVGSHSKEWRDLVSNNGLHPSVTVDERWPRDLAKRSSYTNTGRQVTADENHTFSATSLQESDGDVGGDFTSTRQWVRIDDDAVFHFDKQGFDPGGTWRHQIYDGPIVATNPTNLPIPSVSLSNLNAAGATAIARCKPTNNVANLGTSVSEIFRDGLPALFGHTTWKERTHKARAAGGEYLNYEFGWLPLVSDIRNAAYSVANAHRLMSQYEAHSGHEVRRRYEFPVTDTKTISTVTAIKEAEMMGSLSPLQLFVDVNSSRGTLYKLTRNYKRTWFSGAFTYHLPYDYSSRNWLSETANKAGYLLGIELTPDVVWNVLPWSWAADWFSNLGDVISNLSDWATDGLVMRYGYVMEHSFTTDTYYLDRATRYKPVGSIYASTVTACYESKRRVKASPFGFGLSWNSFTPRQLAIAVALGITRVF